MDQPRSTTSCPICGVAHTLAPKQNPSFPFCSRRCKLVDLDRWLSGDYRIPALSVGGPHPGPHAEDGDAEGTGTDTAADSEIREGREP